MNMDQSTQLALQQLIELESQQVGQNQQILQYEAQRSNNQQAPSFAPDYTQHSQNYSAPPTQNYLPPMMPVSSATMQQAVNFQGYAGQLGGKDSYGLADVMLPNYSRTSPETRQMMAADYGSKVGSAVISGAGTLLGTGMDLFSQAVIPGLIGSTAVGMAGGAAIGGLFDIGLDQNKQAQAYNKYLMRESYRFIDPLESNNERGIAGFGTEERQDASSFLRHFNSENHMEDSEVMNALQKFTESGMLKDSKDLKGFKEKMTSLTKTVREGALVLNETYDTIADMMSEMKKAGIADKSFDDLISKSKVVGAMTGMSGTKAWQSGMNGALGLTQGTEYSTDKMFDRVQNEMMYGDDMYQKLLKKKQEGTIDPEETRTLNAIVGMGGPTQVAPQLVGFQNDVLAANNGWAAKMGISFFDYDKSKGTFNFNQEEFNNFVNGKDDINTVESRMEKKLNALDKNAQNKWFNEGQTYMINSMNFDQEHKYQNRFFDAMSKSKDFEGFSRDQILDVFGIKDSPLRQIYLADQDEYNEDGGRLRKKMDNLSAQEKMLARINSNRVGFMGDLKEGWEKFKDTVGDRFQPVGDFFTDLSLKTQDWLYGKKYQKIEIDKPYDFSAQGTKKEFDNVRDTMKAVQDSFKLLDSKGVSVDPYVAQMFDSKSFDFSEKETSDDYRKVTLQKFSSDKGLDKELSALSGDMKEKYKLLKDQGDKNDLSDTIVAALLKFGQQSGKGVLGMSQSALEEASKTLGKKVLGAGDGGFKDGTDYLGQLMQRYGGNQDLALGAFLSSQQGIDSALRGAGIDPSKKSSLYGVKLGDLKGVDNTVVNAVNGVNSNASAYTGGSHDGARFDVNGGRPIPQGLMYDPTMDYKRGAKGAQMDSATDDNGQAIDTYSLIHHRAKEFGLSPNFIAGVVATETGGKIHDPSPAGAQGIMQLMPENFSPWVGKEIPLPDGTKKTVGAGDIDDPYINSYIGTTMLSDSMKEYNNNPYLAYTAYNAGPGVVNKLAQIAFQDYHIGNGSWNDQSRQALSSFYTLPKIEEILKTRMPANTETPVALMSLDKHLKEGAILTKPEDVTETKRETETTTKDVYENKNTGVFVSAEEFRSRLKKSGLPSMEGSMDQRKLSNVINSLFSSDNTPQLKVSDRIDKEHMLGEGFYRQPKNSFFDKMGEFVFGSSKNSSKELASKYSLSSISKLIEDKKKEEESYSNALTEDEKKSKKIDSWYKPFTDLFSDDKKNAYQKFYEARNAAPAKSLMNLFSSAKNGIETFIDGRKRDNLDKQVSDLSSELTGKRKQAFSAFGDLLGISKGTNDSDYEYQKKVQMGISDWYNKTADEMGDSEGRAIGEGVFAKKSFSAKTQDISLLQMLNQSGMTKDLGLNRKETKWVNDNNWKYGEATYFSSGSDKDQMSHITKDKDGNFVYNTGKVNEKATLKDAAEWAKTGKIDNYSDVLKMSLNGDNVKDLISQLDSEYKKREKDIGDAIMSSQKVYGTEVASNEYFKKEDKEKIRDAYMNNDRKVLEDMQKGYEADRGDPTNAAKAKAITDMLDAMGKGIEGTLKPLTDAKKALEDLQNYKNAASQIDNIIGRGIDLTKLSPDSEEANLVKDLERLSKVLDKSESTSDIAAALEQQQKVFEGDMQKILASTNGEKRYDNIVQNAQLDPAVAKQLAQEMADAMKDGGPNGDKAKKAVDDLYNAVADAASKMQETKNETDKAKASAETAQKDIESLNNYFNQIHGALSMVSSYGSRLTSLETTTSKSQDSINAILKGSTPSAGSGMPYK